MKLRHCTGHQDRYHHQPLHSTEKYPLDQSRLRPLLANLCPIEETRTSCLPKCFSCVSSAWKPFYDKIVVTVKQLISFNIPKFLCIVLLRDKKKNFILLI